MGEIRQFFTHSQDRVKIQKGKDTQGYEPPSDGGGNMEARIARLEASVAHLERDVSDIKQDVREIRRDLSGLRKELYYLIAGLALGLSGLMAKGFHWIP